MSTYLNEEEQLDALKKWWKENGKSVVIGATLGFAIILGWQGWGTYRVSQGELASQRYADMQQAVPTEEKDKLRAKAQALIKDYASSEYAALAAMQLAKLAYVDGDKEKAREHLLWVTQNTHDDVLKDIARLRLAKLLLDMQQTEAVKNLLTESSNNTLNSEFTQLRGDLAYQSGDLEAAQRAYQEALQGVGDSTLLEMKLADMAGTN